MDIEIEVVVSFRMPLPFEKVDALYLETYEQILQVHMHHDFHNHGTFPIVIERVKSNRANTMKKYLKGQKLYKLISLKCNVADSSYKIKITDGKERKWTKQEKRQAYIGYLVAELEFATYLLTFASNLARPGTMSIGECPVFVNGQYYKTFNGISSELVFLFTQDRKFTSWPKIDSHPVPDVWNWLYPLKDFKNAFGATSLGRGLCAFSYFFLQNIRLNSAEPLEDLWALVGLETLYKTNGSRSQLKERIRLFLGDHQRLNSLIDDLYKIRSSVIHGGMDMPFSFCPHAGANENERFEEKSTRVAESSTALLVATIQKMFKLNIHDIKYEQRLVLEQKS